MRVVSSYGLSAMRASGEGMTSDLGCYFGYEGAPTLCRHNLKSKSNVNLLTGLFFSWNPYHANLGLRHPGCNVGIAVGASGAPPTPWPPRAQRRHTPPKGARRREKHATRNSGLASFFTALAGTSTQRCHCFASCTIEDIMCSCTALPTPVICLHPKASLSTRLVKPRSLQEHSTSKYASKSMGT